MGQAAGNWEIDRRISGFGHQRFVRGPTESDDSTCTVHPQLSSTHPLNIGFFPARRNDLPNLPSFSPRPARVKHPQFPRASGSAGDLAFLSVGLGAQKNRSSGRRAVRMIQFLRYCIQRRLTVDASFQEAGEPMEITAVLDESNLGDQCFGIDQILKRDKAEVELSVDGNHDAV